MKANTYLILNRYQKSRTADRRPYVTLACEHGAAVRKKMKPIVDDEEEEESKWIQVRIDNCSYTMGGTTIKLTEEQLHQTEQFRKSHVPPCNILRLLREQNVGCTVRYNGLTQSSIETVRRATYNMPLLEAVRMTPTGNNFTVATAFMCNEQATTYRWSSLKTKIAQRFVDGSWHKLINTIDEAEYRRKLEVLKSSVETTKRAESEHSVLKLWLSTCHGDLDTVFLNIDSLIEEKYGAKSNPMLKNISNTIYHLALKRIWLEIKRAGKISDDPQSKCGHYLRKSHGLSRACELAGRYVHALLLQAEDIYIFWRKLEIGVDILNVHERDMDSEMRDLTSMLEEISMGSISKVREVRLIKGFISPVLPDDPCATPPKSRSRRDDGRRIQPKGIRSTTVLPFYSNMDCTTGTLCIEFISDEQHFIQLHMRDGCPLPPMHVQWQYHRDVGVSGWADQYYERIAEWIRRSRTSNPTRGSTHVVIP
ncbi:hypothetical protein M9H77_02656 [Catharanthus roseus]|uniref:Uncharacterized protein n=1 Tax=Catharanthus roseus TaxID=4058 RepID=A0ACC0C8X4_CATRO|nr:hypothetical protein M9H77_02656 [Catharanthus roseus]